MPVMFEFIGKYFNNIGNGKRQPSVLPGSGEEDSGRGNSFISA